MFWKVRATPRAVMRSARQPVMSWPSRREPSGGGREHAGDEVEQRRLAGAVRARSRRGWRRARRTRSTSATAVNPPNDFVSPSTCEHARPPSGAGTRGMRQGRGRPISPHGRQIIMATSSVPKNVMRHSWIDAQDLRQQRDGDGPRHRAPEAAHAAEEHDDEDLGGAVEAELGGVDEERVVRVERAAHAGDEGAEPERGQLQPRQRRRP